MEKTFLISCGCLLLFSCKNVSDGVSKYSAEREESRLTTFSHFSEYLCHKKCYEYVIHIKMIFNLY